MNKNCIFIGGTGRSGTSILAEVLGQHSKMLKLPVESRFIVDPGGLIDLIHTLTENWSPYNGSKAVFRFSHIMKLLSKENTLSVRVKKKLMPLLKFSPKKYEKVPLGETIGDDYKKIVDEYLDKLIHTKFDGFWVGTASYKFHPQIISTKHFDEGELLKITNRFVHRLFGEILDEYGKEIWIDHTPFNILHAHYLEKIFPKMKVIHIYRDVRDVISSYKAQNWGGNNALDITLWLKQVLQRWLELKKILPEKTYYQVKLEDLINHQKITLKSMSDFIGVRFEESMMNINLSKGHLGRWKEDLTKDEKKFIQDELLDTMKEYGYSW